MEEKNIIWDPLRRKRVAATPEEEVRQWFIGVLRDGMHVPEHMMMSEVSMTFGSATSGASRHAGKRWRADIVVYGRKARPLMVVECKRPETELDQDTVDQAIRYHRVLNVRYIVITNGLKTFIFQREDPSPATEGKPPQFNFIEKAPTWEEMLCKP